ncbi:hypothetical protein BKA01_003829 [Pseudonocardia eucalypti]|nr:hypothetical protein [Pseudonocardia eucalypti]
MPRVEDEPYLASTDRNGLRREVVAEPVVAAGRG